MAIEYCEISHYEDIATQLGQAVRSEPEVEIRLIPTRGGVFEVSVSGRLVFSKRANHRLPETAEILYHVRAARNALRARTRTNDSAPVSELSSSRNEPK